MKKVVQIEANVAWNCFRAAGGQWVGVCDPLKLTVQSSTWGELMEDIADTLDGILNDLLASNELPQFLRERGWVPAGPLPERTEKNVHFDVPFLPAMMGAHGPQRELHQ
jgi:hypothetical protein